jgi:hypothetical protein
MTDSQDVVAERLTAAFDEADTTLGWSSRRKDRRS